MNQGHGLVLPVLDSSVRSLCTKPYPGHPRGCPNYGKRCTCPPEAPLLEDVFDLCEDVYAVWNAFPLGLHVASMRAKHPKWTDRQLRCCLYWQQRARKQLDQYIERFLEEYGMRWIVRRCPEACGVEVTSTMRQLDIEIPWPPVNTSYQVALVGRPVTG